MMVICYVSTSILGRAVRVMEGLKYGSTKN